MSAKPTLTPAPVRQCCTNCEFLTRTPGASPNGFLLAGYGELSCQKFSGFVLVKMSYLPEYSSDKVVCNQYEEGT